MQFFLITNFWWSYFVYRRIKKREMSTTNYSFDKILQFLEISSPICFPIYTQNPQHFNFGATKNGHLFNRYSFSVIYVSQVTNFWNHSRFLKLSKPKINCDKNVVDFYHFCWMSNTEVFISKNTTNFLT